MIDETRLGGDVELMKIFFNMMEARPLKMLCVEGRIVFKWIIEKLCVNRWSGLNWA